MDYNRKRDKDKQGRSLEVFLKEVFAVDSRRSLFLLTSAVLSFWIFQVPSPNIGISIVVPIFL